MNSKSRFSNLVPSKTQHYPVNANYRFSKDGTNAGILNQVENRKNYSHFGFSTDIPNLIDVQRQSFYSFIGHGFKKALKETLQFSTPTHNLEIQFFPEWIQYQKYLTVALEQLSGIDPQRIVEVKAVGRFAIDGHTSQVEFADRMNKKLLVRLRI